MPNTFQVLWSREALCMILQSWNLYEYGYLLFLHDAYVAHISKDKWKLSMVIKNHPIAHVTFLFSFEIQYHLVNFIFEERIFLSFTRDCNNCWWLVKIREKKQWGQVWLSWKKEGNEQSVFYLLAFFVSFGNDLVSCFADFLC